MASQQCPISLLVVYFLVSLTFLLVGCKLRACFFNKIFTVQKRKKQCPTTMENLSGDILSNIFIRLLAKQLAQMRCVSKSWNTLLSQSSFVKSHLQHSIHNNEKILLLFYNPFEFTAHPYRFPHVELTNFIKLPDNLKSGDANVLGSFNGLICLCVQYIGEYFLQIWNPSLSAVLTLPPFSTASPDYYLTKTFFRFGFDPKTDDYKVVKLVARPGSFILDLFKAASFGTLFYGVREWLQVEVYSMRKGCWQLIGHRFPSHIAGISTQDEVCVDGHDGHLHWLCCIDEKATQQIIVAFDLGEEMFCEIPLPDCLLDHTVLYRHNILGVSGGKLCVMSKARSLEFEVWVMEDYGVVESWVKHLAFSQFTGDMFLNRFGLHNGFLSVAYSGGLALYDSDASNVKFFKKTGRADRVVKIVDYVDSLVWVGPFES